MKDFNGIQEIKEIGEQMVSADIKLAIYELVDCYKKATILELIDFQKCSEVIKKKFESDLPPKGEQSDKLRKEEE